MIKVQTKGPQALNLFLIGERRIELSFPPEVKTFRLIALKLAHPAMLVHQFFQRLACPLGFLIYLKAQHLNR